MPSYPHELAKEIDRQRRWMSWRREDGRFNRFAFPDLDGKPVLVRFAKVRLSTNDSFQVTVHGQQRMEKMGKQDNKKDAAAEWRARNRIVMIRERLRHPWPWWKKAGGTFATVIRADGTKENLGQISVNYVRRGGSLKSTGEQDETVQ